MSDLAESVAQIVPGVLSAPRKGKRRLIAVAGPPASGKSTLADALGEALNARGCVACVVPMDGFHLDNAILSARGDLPRKGAPHSFDARGFLHLCRRLAREDDVYYPLFDRARDLAVAGAGMVQADCDTVIVEGNYLLLDAPIWRELMGVWDRSIALDVGMNDLHQRLVQRWLDHGLDRAAAEARAAQNDLPNARLVVEQSLKADVTV